MYSLKFSKLTNLAGVLLLALAVSATMAYAQGFLGPLDDVSTVVSTVPSNGDVNPYGVVRVPVTMGKLVAGNILVSNFNNNLNQQGRGSTIVQIMPDGSRTLFAKIHPDTLPGPCPGGVGLTTALVALRSGFIVVGSLPTSNGMSPSAKAGCLIVLNASGQVVRTISGRPINGPWDMTAFDAGSVAVLFVTNVLNGTVAGNGSVVNRGMVVRLILEVTPGEKTEVLLTTVIGSGFAERTDPVALVVGPTGVAFNPANGTLYINDSVNSRITAIHNALFRLTSAGTGKTISSGGALNDPLGLTLAPNGDVVAANGNDGNLVEVSPSGTQVAVKTVNKDGSPPGAGNLFGLVALPGKVYFVNDFDNTLDLLSR
jgi:hypothetical protein